MNLFGHSDRRVSNMHDYMILTAWLRLKEPTCGELITARYNDSTRVRGRDASCLKILINILHSQKSRGKID